MCPDGDWEERTSFTIKVFPIRKVGGPMMASSCIQL